MDKTLNGRRILIVEDEYFVADDMRQALENEGADVIGPVASVGEALRVLEQTDDLDAAVLDVNLGGTLVYPVAEALGSRDVPYVFATGYDQGTLPTRYAAAVQVEKPIDERRLGAVLNTLLRHGR